MNDVILAPGVMRRLWQLIKFLFQVGCPAASRFWDLQREAVQDPDKLRLKIKRGELSTWLTKQLLEDWDLALQNNLIIPGIVCINDIRGTTCRGWYVYCLHDFKEDYGSIYVPLDYVPQVGDPVRLSACNPPNPVWYVSHVHAGPCWQIYAVQTKAEIKKFND